MEIQEGKEAMKMKKYQKEMGATAACALRLALGTLTGESV